MCRYCRTANTVTHDAGQSRFDPMAEPAYAGGPVLSGGGVRFLIVQFFHSELHFYKSICIDCS